MYESEQIEQRAKQLRHNYILVSLQLKAATRRKDVAGMKARQKELESIQTEIRSNLHSIGKLRGMGHGPGMVTMCKIKKG